MNGISTKTYVADLILTASDIGVKRIIHNALMKVRNYLIDNLTDPKSASRSADARFVMTAYPERKAEYPHVIVNQVGGGGGRIAGNAALFKYDLLIGIDGLSKSTKQLDEICDDILYQMLQGLKQNTFRDYGLYSMRIPAFFRPNPMPEGSQVHRKSAEYAFYVYVS